MRLLQTSCGLLAAASLVALGMPAPGVVAHDGAATVGTVASAHPAVPTEWSGGGPLAIPTIGVVPPGTEDWFDPTAAPSVRTQPALPTAVSLPSVHDAPTRDADEPSPASPAPSFPAEAAAASTTEATQPSSPTPATTSPTTTPPAATARTAAPETTTPETTTPETTTPETTTPETTTPETTTPGTTAPSTTAPPSTTTDAIPSATPTRPAPETNERGNVVLAFGDALTVYDGETGAVAFALAVDSVDTDVRCAEPASPSPTNGSLVAVLVRVTTGPDLAAVGGEPAVRTADFSVGGPDGGTLVGAGTPSAASCAPVADVFPGGPLAAGQELTGVVVLDVPATSGRLVFAPDFLPVGAEWAYGTPAAE